MEAIRKQTVKVLEKQDERKESRKAKRKTDDFSTLQRSFKERLTNQDYLKLLVSTFNR